MALSVQLQPERRSWYRQLHRRTRTSCQSEEGLEEDNDVTTGAPAVHHVIQRRSHRFTSEDTGSEPLTFDTQYRRTQSMGPGGAVDHHMGDAVDHQEGTTDDGFVECSATGGELMNGYDNDNDNYVNVVEDGDIRQYEHDYDWKESSPAHYNESDINTRMEYNHGHYGKNHTTLSSPKSCNAL